jgi:hypothetical protein
VRKLVRILMLLAAVTATLGPIVPAAAAAQPCAMMMSMDGGHASDGMNGMMPACADMSCLIMCALPTPLAATSTHFAWSAVHYATADVIRSGQTIPPAQSPPIA